MWVRFDIWVGFPQRNDNNNRPNGNDYLWLLLFTNCFLLVLAILLNKKWLIIYSSVSIFFLILCILYNNNLLPDYKLLNNLFSPLSISLKLTNPLIYLLPIEYSIIFRFILTSALIQYFTGKINKISGSLILFTSVINNCWINLNNYKDIIFNASDDRGRLFNILNEDFSRCPPENVNSDIVANKANRAIVELNTKRPSEIVDIAERASSKMGKYHLSEKSAKGANHQVLFSFEEHAAIKFLMAGYERTDGVSDQYGNRFGAWTAVGNVEPRGDNSLHVYGPLTHTSKFVREFRNRLGIYKSGGQITW